MTPDFEYTAFYFADLRAALRQYGRQNVPEITDEADEEPFMQLEIMMAVIGHMNNVNTDIAAGEALWATATLPDSVFSWLSLIGFELRSASPSAAELVLKLSKIFEADLATFLPDGATFATEETAEDSQKIFEVIGAKSIQQTDELDAAFEQLNGIPPTGSDLSAELNNPVSSTAIWAHVIAAGDALYIGHPDIMWNRIKISGELIPRWTPDVSIIANTNTVDQPTAVGQPFLEAAESYTVEITATATNSVTARVIRDSDSVEVVAPQAFVAATPVTIQDDLSVQWVTISGDYVSGDSWKIQMDLNSVAAWEYFQGVEQADNPDSVVDQGSTIRLNVNDYLGAENRAGAEVVVTQSLTGATETAISQWDGTDNYIETATTLGQTAISLKTTDYAIGGDWVPIGELGTDETLGFTNAGEGFSDRIVAFELPQTLTRKWQKATVNGVEGFWMRIRVVTATIAAAGSVTLKSVDIADGDQFYLVDVAQGQTFGLPDPLTIGASDGTPSQSFELPEPGPIDGTIEITIDIGGGALTNWTRVSNFLNSDPTDRHYVIDVIGDGTASVIFGDGINGAIPPSTGSNNIFAKFRFDAEENGNVGSNTIAVNRGGAGFVSLLYNPRPAIGWAARDGATDESIDELKIIAPESTVVRNRGVSGPDIEFLAEQFVSSNGTKPVARAFAFEDALGPNTIELITVGAGGAALSQSILDELDLYFNGNDAVEGVLLSNRELTSNNYTPLPLDVDMTVTGSVSEGQVIAAITAILDPTLKKVDDEGNELPEFEWEFGGIVYRARFVAAAFDIGTVQNAVVNVPTTDITLGLRSLPTPGTITATVNP